MRELLFWGLSGIILILLTWSNAPELDADVITYCERERARCYKFNPGKTGERTQVYAKFMNRNPSVRGHKVDPSDRYDPVQALRTLTGL